MTTLTASSSPELSGQNWLRIVALYGVGPLIAVILTIWLTNSVSAKQNDQLADTKATKALVEQHVAATHTQLEETNSRLDRIGRQLEANCKVQAGKNTAMQALCEVGR